jgi:hypothetical protein
MWRYEKWSGLKPTGFTVRCERKTGTSDKTTGHGSMAFPFPEMRTLNRTDSSEGRQ